MATAPVSFDTYTVHQAEACRLLRCDYRTLHRLVARGRIRCLTTPRGRRRFPLAEVLGLTEAIPEMEGASAGPSANR